MHLIIPFAASHAESGLAALRQLELPHLDKLLRRLQALPPEQDDALSLSPPHERVHARALGLPVIDGQIPWAALLAQQQHVDPVAQCGAIGERMKDASRSALERHGQEVLAVDRRADPHGPA